MAIVHIRVRAHFRDAGGHLQQWRQPLATTCARILRVRFHIIGNLRIENVGKSQSCMVSKLRIIWKQTVFMAMGPATAALAQEDGAARVQVRAYDNNIM